MEYSIVNVGKEHLPMIESLEQKTFSLPMSIEVMERMVDDNTVIFIAAVSSDLVLGYASLKYVEYEGFVNNIAVDGQYRNKGIGESMIRNMLLTSKKLEITDISLEVRESNEAAIGLYKKIGFYQDGIIKNYYTKPKENAIIMRTLLDNGTSVK